MENSELRIASRTSPLAIFQTNEVINRLKEIHSDYLIRLSRFLQKEIRTKAHPFKILDRLVFLLKRSTMQF